MPIVFLLTSMISLQSGAAIAKQVIPSLGAAGTATLRLCFASAILCAVYRPWRERISVSALSWIALYGVVLGSMNYLFCLALLHIPLGVAVALEFMGPLAVAVLTSRKKVDFLWIGMATAGVIILLPKSEFGAALPWQGIFFALCAAFCWALYIIVGKKAGTVASSGTVTSIGMLAGAAAITPLGIASTGWTLFDLSFWPTMLVIAILSSAVPYSLEMVALKTMPARTFGILMSLEPAVASLYGMMILHEYLNGTEWAAVAAIMLASFGAIAFAQRPKVSAELGV